MATRRDTSTFLFLHDDMPDHPKIEGLSDAAFRSLIRLWCNCSKHLTDGYVTQAAWLKRTTPKVRRELIAADLVDLAPDRDGRIPTGSRRDSAPNGVLMHDYLDWQRSAAEAAEQTSKKAEAGTLGNHRRWHVAAGKRSADCKFCVGDDPDRGTPDPSHEGSQVRSQDRSQTDRTKVAEVEEERDRGSVGRERPDRNARTRATPSSSPPSSKQQRPLWPAEVNDHPTRCAAHADIPPGVWIKPCGACATKREQHDLTATAREAAAVAEQEQAATVSAEQAAACEAAGTCDGRWVLVPNAHGGRVPAEPARKCTHGLAPPGGLRAVG